MALFTDQEIARNNALNKRDKQYQAQFQSPTTSSTAQTMASRYSAPQQSQQTTDYRSILDSVRSKLTQPRQTFQYNPDTDQTFQAAAKAVRSGVGTAQANTNARLRASGQGKSSYSETVANQIAQRAEDQISNQIRPQYEQQAYSRFQNEQNAERQGMNDLLAVGQGYNSLEQQGFQNELSKAQESRNEATLTGRYLPPAVQDRINQVLDLKRQAEQPGVTSEQMGQFKTRADAVRGQLAQLGVDPSVVGYDSDYNQASQNASNFSGIPTLASREQDSREQAQKFNQDLSLRGQDLQETQVMAALTGQLPDGTPTNAAQQQQLQNQWMVAEQTGTIPDGLADLYGLPRGTQTQAAKAQAFNQSAENRRISLSAQGQAINAGNAAASRDLAERRFQFEKEQATQPKQLKDTEISDLIDSSPLVQKQYDNNGKLVGAAVPEENKNSLAQYIASIGLPPDEAKKWFIRYGLWSGK